MLKKIKDFGGDLWSIRKGHNREAEWQKDIKNEQWNDKHCQERMVISVDKVTKQCRKMPYWKGPGKDGVQGYWIKNLGNRHERIAIQLNQILMGDESLPAWMAHSCPVPCQKDARKGNAVENYHPITSLPLMWKLVTGVIAEEMYDYLEQKKLLPEENSYNRYCIRQPPG